MNLGLEVPVLVSNLQLKTFIRENPSGLAKAIISNEMYESSSDNGKHVYTIAYQKVKEYHILYVYDVAGAELPMNPPLFIIQQGYAKSHGRRIVMLMRFMTWVLSIAVLHQSLKLAEPL